MSTTNLSEELLSKISFLDAFSGSNGVLSTKGRELVANPSDQTIIDCLMTIMDIKKQIDSNSEARLMIKSVYDVLLPFLGKIKIRELINKDSLEEAVSHESFEDLYTRLDSLIGLDKVKNTIRDLIAYHRIQMLRGKAGLKMPNRTLHLAFLGNPGTGKTTVARIVGKMYRHLGLLSKGHFLEVSRTDLIAGYQGQTALKVKKVIERAKGGVLFIDEAYSLTENNHSDAYGRECLTELTKALEDYRKDLVVIVAGYTDLMKSFFESNPGLKSRFNTFIEFNDYSSVELVEIFTQMCQQDDYTLSEECQQELSNIIASEVSIEAGKFANGRFVRNLYEDILMNHARRLSSSENITPEDLTCFTLADLAAKVKNVDR